MTANSTRLGTNSKTRGTMRQRAVVERPFEGVRDDWGHNDPSNMRVTYTALPCLVTFQQGSGPTTETRDADKIAVVQTMRLLVPANTDIRPGDFVAEIRDRIGRPLFSRFEILGVLRRRDHLDCSVREVSSGTP